MKRVGQFVLWLVSLPFNVLIAWPLLLIFRLVGFVRDVGTEPNGVIVATFTKRWTGQLDTAGRPRRWPWSTTLSHAIAYQERHRAPKGVPLTDLQRHEHTHREQAENMALRAFVIAAIVFTATGDWILAFALWATSYAWLATNFVATWMRGGSPYYGSEHEEHARSQEKGDR